MVAADSVPGARADAYDGIQRIRGRHDRLFAEVFGEEPPNQGGSAHPGSARLVREAVVLAGFE